MAIRISRDNHRVIIAVEDHGHGIPESIQPFVFQKFVQSRRRQIHNIPSTGLGLTIVKYITEAHQGQVYFETYRTKGKTFYIELPITRDAPTSETTT